MSVSVVVVSTLDPVLREVTALSALSELPRTAVLRFDVRPDQGELRRVFSDTNGVIEDSSIPMDQTCMGCAVRDETLRALDGVGHRRAWDRILLLPPITADATAASRPLAQPDVERVMGIRVAGVVAVVDADTVADDIMGRARLSDRALALGSADCRTVGEALSALIAHADLLLTVGGDATGLTVIDHLRGAGSERGSLYDTSGASLFAPRHHPVVADSRIDPRRFLSSVAPDANGVWSLELATRRPLHPARFVDCIADLGSGRVRSTGRFVLPTRMDTVGVWNGAGGRVCIGNGGGWSGFLPSTRLVFTGIHDDRIHDDRDRLRNAFQQVPLTDAEWALGAEHWQHTDDGLTAWLGS